MSTYLFTAHAAAMGHLNPLLTIGRQLTEEGHTVVFAGFTLEATEKAITANGFRLIKLRPPIASMPMVLIPYLSGFWETFFALKMFFTGIEHYAKATGQILDELSPQVVVTDFTFVGPCLAAEQREIPYITVYHAGAGLPGPGIPPMGTGWPIGGPWGKKEKFYRALTDGLLRSVARTVARARKRLHLPSKGQDPFSAIGSPYLTLVLTAEAIEVPHIALPPTFFFIGPCFAGRKSPQAARFPFDQFALNQPKIYISLGTVFNRKPAVFQKIFDAFADGRYQLIVNAGNAYATLRSQSVPSHILLFDHVPQVEVLARVDAVISHGGNNTVNETLAAGKPLLVMPVGGEQGDNASRVVYLGAGLRTNLLRSTSQEISTMTDRLLEEPAFCQNVARMAEALAQTQGPATAARFIERVATTRQPVVRPAGYPLTVTRDLVPPWEFERQD